MEGMKGMGRSWLGMQMLIFQFLIMRSSILEGGGPGGILVVKGHVGESTWSDMLCLFMGLRFEGGSIGR